MELQGVTTFASPPAPFYRYVLTVKNEKLSIWMEDPASKKQWFKGDMDQASYLTPANTVAGASIADYVTVFHRALNCSLDGPSDFDRELTAQDDGGILLELSVKFRSSAFSFPMHYDYAFELSPGSVERVYALEEQLRDKDRNMDIFKDEILQLEAKILELRPFEALQRQQKEELDRVRAELERLHLELRERHIVQLEATRTDENASVCWNKMESPGVAIEEGGKVVTIRRPDLYLVHGLVMIPHGDFHNTVWLVKNGKKLRQSHTVGISEQDQVWTLLIALVALEEGDELAVKSTTDTLYLRYLYVWGASNRT